MLAKSNLDTDLLIIGSGAAGLTCALHAAQQLKVTVVCKQSLNEGATHYAQGGIAAVIDDDDSPHSHINDTLVAGAGLCHQDAVEHTVFNSRAAITWLIEQGVPFTQYTDTHGQQVFHLTREGGHSHRRVLHAADQTGAAVQRTLVEQVQQHPNIQLYDHHMVIDLVRDANPPRACIGAYVLDLKHNQVLSIRARATVLASGGASKVYLYTSNPDVASGDGIAMAWRAGCYTANLEFNQFHPTTLYHPSAPCFLITEAMRGEGAVLLNSQQQRFMPDYDARAELAPRDIVARAIDQEIKRLGSECVYLDISHKPREFIQTHFPNIYQKCQQLDIDISQSPIPVVPAAHYTCGGVVTDLHGCTNVPSLYAIGEVACTGLHGANRMASNSILECIVFAQAASQHICAHIPEHVAEFAPWDDSRITDAAEAILVRHNWLELRQTMWNYVGIVRSDSRLRQAYRRVQLLKAETEHFYAQHRISGDLLELRNLCQVAELIIRSAMQRKESRGLHYTLDYPEPAASAQDTILYPGF